MISDLAEIVTRFAPDYMLINDIVFWGVSITAKGIMVYGMKQGLFVTKWSNGKTKNKCWWINGKQHGLEQEWSKYGEKSISREWANGEQHGIEKIWHDNGQVHTRLSFYHGQCHGREERWWRDGTRQYEAMWDHGNVLSRINM